MIKRDFCRGILVLFILFLLLIIAFPGVVGAQTLVWVVTSNPSSSWDRAYSITSDDNYIYIAGDDYYSMGDWEWRIEKRRKSDGGVEWAKTSNPSSGEDTVYSITSDNAYIYITGSDESSGDQQWHIEKRRKSDGGLEWAKTSNPAFGWDMPYAITSDGTYIYVAGCDASPGDYQWRIEKRRKSDGEIEWAKTSNPSLLFDEIRSITSDDTYIYIAGTDESATLSASQWRIEKRRKSDGGVEWTKTSNPSSGWNAPFSITSDDTYIYIAGYDDSPGLAQWRIEKRRKSDGEIEWAKTSNPSFEDDMAYSITSDQNYIYIAGMDNAPGNDEWRMEKRRKSDGGVEWTVTSDPQGAPIPSASAMAIATDGAYVYVAGYDNSPNNYEWRIEKREIGTTPDTTPPTGTISISNGAPYTNSTSVTLTLSASDPGSGVSKMKFSNNGVTWSSEEDYATSKTWTLTSGDGTKTVYVQYEDNAGNWSASITDTIILDTILPTGTISINSGAEYTSSTSVTLTLSASDSSGVSKMRFSNDGVSWSAEENYATSKSWTLTAGDGTKTVYVRYKDNAGNWSGSITDTIVLNTTPDSDPPTGTISINSGAQYTNSTSVTLTLSASDSGSGVSKMRFSNDGVSWSAEENYGTSKTWTLTSGDGTKTVYVQYKDNAGNWSGSITDTIILDTILPTGTISINSGAQYTSSTSVTLTLSASDSGSGVSKMRFGNDGASWSSEENYATSKSWTLTAGDGTKTVYVQYKDNAGNWSASITDTIILDTTPDSDPPTGTILINSGAQYTNSTSATLTLSASDPGSGVSKMRFSNDGVSWSAEENYATSKSWTLTAGDGTKTVYVQYKDNAGNWSGSITDTIILDTVAPTGTISINSGAQYTNSTSVTLTLSASDSGSGLSKMRFSNDGVSWSAEENYATSKSWTLTTGDGTKTVYVQYKDNAGNWSGSITDTIILDTILPTGTISINSGAQYTNSTSVTLTLSASDSGSGLSKMRFSNDGVSWSAEENYGTSKTWTLTSGDGTKTVYVQYKDNAGNWSASITDTIILDTILPTGTISINSGAQYTSSTSVTLTLSASDSGSGVSKMRFSNDGASWSAEENYATSKSWTLTAGDGTKTVYVQYKDNANNWSASITDTMILDTVAPTGTISINSGAQYTNSTSVTLTLSASDSGSGVSKMRFSNDGVSWSGEENYATSKTWTLTSGDGTKTVYVQYKDNAGNWSGSITDTIILDTVAPTGTISINSGAQYTNSTLVTLTLSASDGGGVSKMRFSNDGVSWSAEEDYVTSKTWTLTAGDGAKTVNVQYKDNANNWSGSISDTIILDTTGPTGTILINSGDEYTGSTSVTLTLSASDGSGVSKMRFSNNGVSWSSEEDYATSKSWALTAGDGAKTVYVQYKDNANNWSGSISDTIILDTTGPTGTILINNGDEYTGSTSVTLTLSASSGVTKMRFSNDGVVWSIEENYATSKSWTLTAGDGTKTVYVQYKDSAGNWSASISDTIVLDATGPTGTITINNGDGYTNSNLVTLTLLASDSNGVSKMRFSNDGVNWGAEENYATSKSWTLTAGDGTKTVYVQYRDSAGNWSASISDTIVLDATGPTGTILINNGDEYTGYTSVTLTLSASDSNGVSKMRFSNNGVSWSSEEDYGASKSWALTAGDGTKTVYVQYKDNANNWSGSISDTIILDTSGPTGTILINNGDGYTNSTSVTLTLSASIEVIKMRFSNDGVVWSSEEDYATSKSWTLTAGDGIKRVYVQYRDSAGNWSPSISDTIILDTTGPTGTISINSGAQYTNSTSVTLTLSASDSGSGVSKMRFSNDGASWSAEEDYDMTRPWTLTAGDGTKTVYVCYKDNTGNWSGSISDTIILDTTPPTGTILINNGNEYTNSTSVTLTLSASDGSGASKMRFSNNGVSWSSEEDYATSKSWALTAGDGTKTVYVCYKDNANNWSPSISDTIILDTTGPTGTIFINNGDEYTGSASVTLTLSASGEVIKMRFSNDGVVWSGEEDYGVSKSWALTAGDGTRTVYVQYKDNAGNWSGSISDTIILDTTPPTGTISINNGNEYTNSTSVTLTLSASDSNGVSKMRFSNDGVGWGSEENYATSKFWALTGSDGPKTVYVRYKDSAGNWSDPVSDTITLDTVLPMVKLLVDKARILPDGEIVGVLPDKGMEAKFSKVMDKEAVKEGLELIAGKDNLNNTINEKVVLNFDWDSSSETVRVTSKAGNLDKNFLYNLKVTDKVKDLAGNTITGEKELIFRTIMDHTKKNVVVKATNERLTLTLEANALKEDGYLIINTEPLTYQFEVSPETINVACEKSITNGWYPIEGYLWEIKVCKENGDWIEDKFGSEVKIMFPYEEANGIVGNGPIALNEKTLLAFWLNEEHSNWVRVPGSELDKENNVVVTGEVPNFSVFALMGSALHDLSDAHAYPVPWKPNDGKDETGTEQEGITFTNLSAQGIIRIYTVSGELVREYDYEPADKGKWRWDVKTSNGEKVFSGVYIYYIENEQEQKTGRLIIIR